MQVAETTSEVASDAAPATVTLGAGGEPIEKDTAGEAGQGEKEAGEQGEGAEKQEPELTPREKDLAEKLEAAQREKDNLEKAKKSMQRRIDRITREAHQPQQQGQQAQPQGQGQQELTPEQIQAEIDRKAAEIAAQRDLDRKCDDVAKAAEKLDKDFTRNFTELLQETGPMFDQRGRPLPLMTAILEAEDPAKLLVHLTENRDIAAELADLTPTQQIRRIAKLETEIEAAEAEKKKPKQPSNAPKPATPVKTVAAGDEPDPADAARWIRWDMERQKRK